MDRRAIMVHLPLYRATMLHLPLDLLLVQALGLPRPNHPADSSLTRLPCLLISILISIPISILTSIPTSRVDTIQTQTHTKPVHHQLTPRLTRALILPTRIGNRVHARHPASSLTPSIHMTL